MKGIRSRLLHGDTALHFLRPDAEPRIEPEDGTDPPSGGVRMGRKWGQAAAGQQALRRPRGPSTRSAGGPQPAAVLAPEGAWVTATQPGGAEIGCPAAS